MVVSLARHPPLSRSPATWPPADVIPQPDPAIVESEREDIRRVRVFVSSPGDAIHERGRVDRVVERLNGEFAGTARLETIRWETEFYRADTGFQPQIPEAAECDIVIAVFRHRIGTELPPSFARLPDGSPYPSGTGYEVLSAIEHCRRFDRPDVYVFRHLDPPLVRLDDPEAERTQQQWERLKAFWETWFLRADGTFKGAFHRYNTIDDFDAQLDRLLTGWLEKKILHTRAVRWPVEVLGSPFRGLAAFGAKHKEVFFGRSRDTTRAAEEWKDAAARGSPFLLVVGASGAGKSSLARAGLVPRITAPEVVPSVDLWRVAVMHPSEASDGPIASLAARLFDGEEDIPDEERGRAAALPELAESDYRTPAELARLFAEAGAAAIAPVMRALGRAADAERARQGSSRPFCARLLIVIDQLDELFAPSVAPEQRALFVRLLASLQETGQVWLLATLRADLYEHFVAEPGLVALKTSGAAYDLSRPGPAELAEIVRKPAEAAGLAFETDATTSERLDERLLREADRPDMLPLLQLALDRLFEARVVTAEGPVLTVGAYESLGGLAGIIDREAERALMGLDQADIGRLPRLVRQLAAIGEVAGEASVTPAILTIRTVPLADATPDAPSQRLVHALVEARILLTTGEGAACGVRLAHQRVLTNWARARRLAEESIQFFSICKEVEDRRRIWDDSGRTRDQLIQPGRSLSRAESIAKDFGEELSPATREFVAASGRRARLRQRLTAAAAIVFAVFAVVASAAGILASREERRARESLDAAQQTVNIIVVEIAQSLRYVEGLRTETIRGILEKIKNTVNLLTETADEADSGRGVFRRVEDLIESLTGFAPNNSALWRLHLKLLDEFATTYQTAGDMQSARSSAMAALAKGRELALRHEDDREWQHNVSLTLDKLGSIALSNGEATEALKDYQQALAILRPLTERDPNNGIWRRELAMTLEGIGNVRSQTGDARGALAAYDEGLAIIRNLARDDPDNLELERQIALRVIETGDMKLTTGDITAAEADYQEGLKIARRLVEQEPGYTQWQRDVFFSLTKIGDLEVQAGNPAAAMGHYGEAVAIVHHLAKLDPGNPRLSLDVAEGLCKIGDVDPKARDRDYEDGLAIMRRLVQRYPDNSLWQREFSVSLNKIGDVKLGDNDADGALAAYSEALTVVGRLAGLDPGNLVWLRDVALSLGKVGDVKLHTGNTSGAIANYEQALQKLRALSTHDPNNTLWLEDLMATATKLGNTELQTGNTNGAATSFDQSLAAARKVAEHDTENTLWQFDLWLALNNVGDVKLHNGDARGAIADYQEALAISRSLSGRDPKNTSWLRNLTVMLNKLGDAQVRTGDINAAAARFEESLAVARRLSEPDPGNAQWQSDLWYALYNLGQVKVRQDDTAAARELYREGLRIMRALAAADPGNGGRQTNLVVNLVRIASLEDCPDREQAVSEALAILERLRAVNRLTPDQDRIRQMLAKSHECG